MRPVIRSMSVSGTPLYGTCTTSMPAAKRNCSAFRCVPLPTPDEPKLSWPGFCFASAINSLTDFAPSEGDTSSRLVLTAIWLAGAKSLTGSYGSFE